MASLAAAQAAKDSLRQKLQGQPWCRGVELVQNKCICPDPYELQVIVDSETALRELTSCPFVPSAWMGVPFSFSLAVGTDGLGVAITTQDYANVALGFMTLTATFLVGKIIVESIIESRREHFDPQGQPPEAVKSKETTMDGIIKLAVMGYSIYSLQQEVPELLSSVKGLLK